MALDLGLISKMAPVAARHCAAYIDLAGEEAATLGNALRGRLIATLVGAFSVFFAVALGVTWLVSVWWDTPQRQVVVGGLFALFAVASVIALSSAFARGLAHVVFPRVRRAWQLDQAMLQSAFAEPQSDRTTEELDLTELRRVGV